MLASTTCESRISNGQLCLDLLGGEDHDDGFGQLQPVLGVESPLEGGEEALDQPNDGGRLQTQLGVEVGRCCVGAGRAQGCLKRKG